MKIPRGIPAAVLPAVTQPLNGEAQAFLDAMIDREFADLIRGQIELARQIARKRNHPQTVIFGVAPFTVPGSNIHKIQKFARACDDLTAAETIENLARSPGAQLHGAAVALPGGHVELIKADGGLH